MDSRRPALAFTPAVEGVEIRQRDRLIDWLDDGLRAGQRGRLEAEYPLSLQPARIEAHRIVWDGDRPLSHAMYHVVKARAPRPIRIGMIGLVYTDPAARGRGLARRCIESCCQALETQGAAIALLWSDKPAFYARLGFHPFGEETRWVVDADVCHAARLESRGSPRRRKSERSLVLDSPRPGDWSRLDALYAKKKFRIDRQPGDLEALAAGPETICVVARRGGQIVAYAALGRGDDFRGVVHEWAGSVEGVLSCFEGLCAESGPLTIQAGPQPGRIASALEAGGALKITDRFALARILDPKQNVPARLYLWGFDSI